jgi:hypothetical protein
MGNDPLGWMITVQFPDSGAPQVYNVAIPDANQAIDAVRRVLPEAKGTIVKVKSELLERVYKALNMRPGVASYVWGRSSGCQSGAIYSLQRSPWSVRKEGLDQGGPIEATKEMRSPIAIAHWGKWRAHLQLMPDPAG